VYLVLFFDKLNAMWVTFCRFLNIKNHLYKGIRLSGGLDAFGRERNELLGAIGNDGICRINFYVNCTVRIELSQHSLWGDGRVALVSHDIRDIEWYETLVYAEVDPFAFGYV